MTCHHVCSRPASALRISGCVSLSTAPEHHSCKSCLKSLEVEIENSPVRPLDLPQTDDLESVRDLAAALAASSIPANRRPEPQTLPVAFVNVYGDTTEATGWSECWQLQVFILGLPVPHTLEHSNPQTIQTQARGWRIYGDYDYITRDLGGISPATAAAAG